MKPESSLPCTKQTVIAPDDWRPQPRNHLSAVLFCPTRATYRTYFVILTELYEKAGMKKFPLCNSLYPLVTSS